VTVLFAGTFSNYTSSPMTITFAPVVTDALSSKYQSVTHDKRFDRAVRRYRKKAEDPSALAGRRRSLVVPALQANLARVSSREPGQPYILPPQPAQTLVEAETRLRARIEPLPGMILKEVLRLRNHTRYFLLANGHGDALQAGGADVTPTPRACDVPDGLKQLLDDVAQEEGFGERLKQEVWDDAHARNVSLLGYT
jgi:potassium channel subfamily K